MLAATAVFRQRELVECVDDLHDRPVEPFLGDVLQVQPRDLLAAEALHRARGLAGPEIAAVAEQCADEALARVVDLRVEAGQRSEQFMKIEPLLCLGEQIQDAELGHRRLDSLIDQRDIGWFGLLAGFVDDQPVIADLDAVVLREAGIGLV
ncbi:hypothetical protein QFZ96_001728 [Paraburkholderia youngii]